MMNQLANSCFFKNPDLGGGVNHKCWAATDSLQKLHEAKGAAELGHTVFPRR